MSRREALVAMLQALFLALMPWLRGTERGLQVAKAGAEQIVSDRVIYRGDTFNITVGIKGFELDDDTYRLLTMDPELRRLCLPVEAS